MKKSTPKSSTWTSKVWVTKPPTKSTPEQYIFPEQVENLVSNPKTGICFSGGGTRSLTACLGQLRALTSNQILDDVGYLSAVSGGSWAATAFTYAPSGTDEHLLGKIIHPENLTFKQLRSNDQQIMGIMGQTALQSGWDKAKELWENSFEKNLLWYEVVGQLFFRPYGLFVPADSNKEKTPKPQSYFGYDDATVALIKKNNPSLANEHFFTVRESGKGVSKRPYLIANATMMGPQNLSNNPNYYVGLELTPYYVGAPHIFQLDYPTSTKGITQIINLGGGFLETFAFGTEAPAQLPGPCTTQQLAKNYAQCVNVKPPARHFNMVEASSMSSAFYAQLLAHYLNDTDFTMVRDIWPVTDTPIQSSTGGPIPTNKDYYIGDGGLLENFGIISQLLRGVEKIMVFVNTSTTIDINYDGTTPPTASQITTVFTQLFGQQLADGTNPYPLDHVFSLKGGTTSSGEKYDGFADVVQDLVAAKKRKISGATEWAGVTSMNKLLTVDNDHWGLPGGKTVEVLWVYLDRVQQWESLLPKTDDPHPEHIFGRPWTMEKYITYGNGGGSENLFHHHYEPVPYFPNYALAYENNDVFPDFRLTPFQVNMMSNLTCWVVNQNAAKIKAWLNS